METDELREQVLGAWIALSGMLKGSRLTKGMTYNEAVVMRLLLDQYRADGIGRVAVQRILRETQMLKSQVNRTVNALCAQGYLEKERGDDDARALFVRPVEAKLPEFLAVHGRSLELVGRIIDVIGEADAESFVRICGKLSAAKLSL